MNIHVDVKVDTCALSKIITNSVNAGVIAKDTQLTANNFKWSVSEIGERELLVSPIGLNLNS